MENINLTIKNNIATLCFNLENEKVNKLSFQVLHELNEKLDSIKDDRSIKLLLITSAKKHIFIAGADINEIREIKEKDEIYNLLLKAHKIFNKLENLPCPTISVIDGACMGGGLELALNTDYRVSTNTSRVKIALPEVKLGIIPGFGGTLRLPRLVGLLPSLDMILSGKTIDAKKAYKLGLIDKYFGEGQLEYKLEEFCDGVLKGKIPKKKKPFSLIDLLPFVRNIVYQKAKEKLDKKLHPRFYSPFRALEVIKNSYGKTLEEGIEIEARAFSKIAITSESKNMIELFFTSEELKKDFKNIKTQSPIERTAVIGGGVMGKGIIWLFTKYTNDIRVKLRKLNNASDIFDSVSKLYTYFLKTRKMTKPQIELKLNKLSFTDKFNGLGLTDLALEAIVEDIDQKKATYKELESNLKDDAIIASNTSSISINKLSDELKHKDRFLGIHFFNPVNMMPLVEVIPSQHISEQNIARTFEFLRRCGKTPVLVGDCAGFLVNRVLLPYINEAGYILEEGGNITHIDKTLKDFGMPMGAFNLTDVVGIDVGYKVADILQNAYGERMKINSVLSSVHNDLKLKGKKAKKGFYLYENNQEKENPEIQKLIKNNTTISKDEIVNRTIFIMVNEASRCLEESIIKKTNYLDFAMIAGTGFPAFRGGLLKYADSIGIAKIVETLENYKERYGDRFTPSDLLYKLRDEQKNFYNGGELWNC